MFNHIPNFLTLGRIALIPPIIVLIYAFDETSRWIACTLFSLAALTDILDGYLARMLTSESRFGRVLDPIADKLLVGAVLLILAGRDAIGGFVLIPAIVILSREILVSGLREHLAELKVPLPVSRLAKWKTALQMIAIAFLIVGDSGPKAIPVTMIGEFCLWIAAALTLVTGCDYLVAAQRHFDASDAPRTGRPGQVERVVRPH
ncbi:MAG: CDP-diacylglycerol--glycerol-3-phosphate 3-phosphatidyltransferase [Alphaproteobacteria bacterium]|nr:CDP-diacylglycerol--glycerol-3-phosphate 3-phosphatidyltransferase [Alphaproteobacteria bacterium]